MFMIAGQEDSMYYIVSDEVVNLTPMMETVQLVAQCAWCTIILEGAQKGQIVGYLFEDASHGCCRVCREKVYASRKSRHLVHVG